MIPIRQSQNRFLIVTAFIRIRGIVNDERPTKTVWILAITVIVIPVSARLGELAWLAHSARLILVPGTNIKIVRK
jgi:hypothetical protein